MAKAATKSILFLDSSPGDRGRAAEGEFNALAGKLGLPYAARCVVVAESPPDMTAATVVIVLDATKVSPLLGEPPPTGPAIEFWAIPSGVEAKTALAREVSGLVARLLGGRVVADAPAPPTTARAKEPAKKAQTVRVGRETAGRRGKGVTTVFDLPLTLDQMKDLAAALKQKCGTGGTVKDGRIEIQGDHRDTIAAELEKIGYKVKRSGG